MTIMWANWHSAPSGSNVCPACGVPIVGFDVRRSPAPVAELAPSFRRSPMYGSTSMAESASAVATLAVPPDDWFAGSLARQFSTATTDAAEVDRGLTWIAPDNLVTGRSHRGLRFRRGH